MKTLRLVFLGLTIVCLHGESYAQKVLDSLRYEENKWSMQKKAMVISYMNLTDAEKSSFWPLYDNYNSAIQYLEIEYIYLVSNYVKNYRSLSPGEFDNLLTQILNNDFHMARVRRLYFKKFKKALSPEIASNFMHLDDTFRNMLRFELQKSLPIGEDFHLVTAKK